MIVKVFSVTNYYIGRRDRTQHVEPQGNNFCPKQSFSELHNLLI